MPDRVTKDERIARLKRMQEEYAVAPAEDATDEQRLIVAVGQTDVYKALKLEGEWLA